MATQRPGRWQRVPARGRLAYWKRDLEVRHRYLAVRAGRSGRWVWQLRGPEHDGPGGYRVHAEGTALTVDGAKAGADQHVANEVDRPCATH